MAGVFVQRFQKESESVIDVEEAPAAKDTGEEMAEDPYYIDMD